MKEAFDVAYDNIYAFHVSQKLPEKTVENMKVRDGSMFPFVKFHLFYTLYINYICPFRQYMKGVRCKRITRCIGSVGLYVPGGTAVLPSTALMLAVVCLPLLKSSQLN